MTFTLYNDCCLKILPNISDNSIDLICADLPYGTTNIKWDSIIPLDMLWCHYKRILTKTGSVVLFGSQPFTSMLVMSNIEWFKYELIWNKNKCGSPGLAKYRPMKTHENLVIFSPKKTVYNPQMEVGEPYSRRSKTPDGYVGKKNDHGYGLKPVSEFSNSGTRYPKSIINISRDFSAQQQIHPTQKPVPLLEWIIKTYSNSGDMVLDNTMGVGTCGIAAVKLSRNFIGIEMDRSYFDISSERISSIQQLTNILP